MSKKESTEGAKAGEKVGRLAGAPRNLFPILAAGAAVFFLMVSMVVAAPYLSIADAPPSERAHEYTGLEAEGRSLYLSLGCFYCHSQFTREYDWGLGNASVVGDFAYDNPHSLGTERTGPDLFQIGGMRPTQWHYIHDRDPRAVSPGSIMPNFAFLTDHQIDALVAYIQNLGQENLDPNNYKPQVPEEYFNATSPYAELMQQIAASYDPDSQTYSGNDTLGAFWGDIFDQGKALYTQNCISCHGCSGNGQGPYARHVVTQPANIHERLSTAPGDFYDFWRVSEGVPGTAMPAWALSYNESIRWLIVNYEKSFINGSLRSISGDISDAEGDNFAINVLNIPQINGTMEDFESGKALFILYCAQCHGADGQGDGPASSTVEGGYIKPEPANFTESGGDFVYYGRYIWKATEGVETTNMPPWKYALSAHEISQTIFYVQTFSSPDDYNTKWGPQYNDSFAQNLMLNATSQQVQLIAAQGDCPTCQQSGAEYGPIVISGVVFAVVAFSISRGGKEKPHRKPFRGEVG